MSEGNTKHSPWGSTLIWANIPGKYTGKIMRIESGQRMSLQLHQYKEETVIVLYGTMLFEKDGVSYQLSPGMYAHIPPGTVHRMGAADEGDFVIVAEVSTFDDGDIIRIEDDYGRD
jgi:mannose-6-phosphate isomerase